MKILKRIQSNFAITTVNSQNYSVKILILNSKILYFLKAQLVRNLSAKAGNKRCRFNSWVWKIS